MQGSGFVCQLKSLTGCSSSRKLMLPLGSPAATFIGMTVASTSASSLLKQCRSQPRCVRQQGVERDGAHDDSDDTDGGAKAAAQQLGLESGPLATVDCSVCMCRPVQVRRPAQALL